MSRQPINLLPNYNRIKRKLDRKRQDLLMAAIVLFAIAVALFVGTLV